MAQEVVRTFDLYNTSVLLPNYTIPKYENEFNISRAFYSTDFSSNPIGSKVDFFVQLDDPCVGVLSANPVFTVPVGLSALDPQWFEQWWDEAMYYSHPMVLETLKAYNPQTFQSFSDSVGTTYFVADSSTPIAPSLNGKIPRNILQQMSRLNDLLNINTKAFTPPGFGAGTSKLASQLKQFTNSVDKVKGIVNDKFPTINRKLPINIKPVGNLVTPPNWNFNTTIQGVNTVVDRLGNVISAPGRALSGVINKIKAKIPVIKLPKLPSIGKLMNAALPGMPAVSNLYNGLKAAASTVQSAVATAQGAMAAAQNVIAAGRNAIGSVQSAITSVTGSVQKLGANLPTRGNPLNNINKAFENNSIIAAIKNQSNTSTSSLNNNAVVLVNKAVKNAKGENSVAPVNTFDYRRKT